MLPGVLRWRTINVRRAKPAMQPDVQAPLAASDLAGVKLLSSTPQPLWWCLARATQATRDDAPSPPWDVAAARLRQKVLQHSCTVRDSQRCFQSNWGGLELLQMTADRLLRPITVFDGAVRKDYVPKQKAPGNPHIVLYQADQRPCYTVGLLEAPACIPDGSPRRLKATIARDAPSCWEPLHVAWHRRSIRLERDGS